MIRLVMNKSKSSACFLSQSLFCGNCSNRFIDLYEVGDLNVRDQNKSEKEKRGRTFGEQKFFIIRFGEVWHQQMGLLHWVL